jgi:hypothetical protein
MPSLSSTFGAEYEQKRQQSAEQTPVSYLQDVDGRSQMRSGLSSHLHASAQTYGINPMDWEVKSVQIVVPRP